MAHFDAWTICGRVTTCETQKELAGLTVTAFDTDWTQDDELGSAVTDSSGKFRIDYTSADFKKTPFSPFINVELFGGPDLYFKVEGSGGTVLLQEPRSRGREADREDVGQCFCVERSGEPFREHHRLASVLVQCASDDSASAHRWRV